MYLFWLYFPFFNVFAHRWHREEDVVSIFDGLSEIVQELTYAFGCGFDGEDRSGFAEAVKAASEADVAVLPWLRC